MATTFESFITKERERLNKAVPPATTNGFSFERIVEGLKFDHPAVQELGLDPEQARALSIGFKARGLHQGAIVLPLYRDGEPVGFAGYKDGVLKLPPKL
jgi:hypothetical protein